MSKTYFGFAIADGMFQGSCMIKRDELSIEEAQAKIQAGVNSCLNLSHKATIDAMQQRYQINVEIPETPPRVTLNPGDAVLVMGVRGLPRLTDRHEYTSEEIEGATFKFSLYTVMAD